jgi:hypothetical protein
VETSFVVPQVNVLMIVADDGVYTGVILSVHFFIELWRLLPETSSVATTMHMQGVHLSLDVYLNEIKSKGYFSEHEIRCLYFSANSM